MNPTAPAQPLGSLESLEGYLAQDPGNDGLRAEAFDTALRLGQLDRAALHLGAGLQSGQRAQAWRLRQGHLQMAQRDWPAAVATLTHLLDHGEPPAALVEAASCDLALIALRTGQPDEGLARLAPLMPPQAAPSPPVQVLWLRLKHHSDELGDLLDHAKAWAAAHALTPEAAGVASLAALDAGELTLSQAWSREALTRLPRQLEALVVQGSLALARQAPAEAQQWLQQALQVNPQDGRAWSAWGFAQMLGGDLAAARAGFDRAVEALPEHIGTWHGLGWACVFQGDLAAARLAFEQALALDRNFAESHGGLAVVLAHQGDRTAAEGAVAVALRLDRHCMSAHYAQAVLQGKADDPAHLQRLATHLMAARARSGSGGRAQ